MLPVLAVTVALLMQAPSSPSPAQTAVRLWRTDSTLYVTMRQPGHLLLMHVDAIGRIDVLFPLVPDDGTGLPGDTILAFDLSPEAQGNPATFVAVRSRWPFDFSVLRMGPNWDYDALLLQPTAGDPLAALLDIADRTTDGRPYEYGTALYSREGTTIARTQPIQPDVCLGCVRRAPAVADVAAAPSTNSVDCSNATLTNSFCGVASAPVTITTPAPPASAAAYQPPPGGAVPTTYYEYPYYFWSTRGAGFDRLMNRPSLPMAPRSQGVAYPIAPRLIVPSSGSFGGVGGRRH